MARVRTRTPHPSVRRRLGEWLALPSTVVAVAILLLGVAFIGLEVQSPNRTYWTGERVSGTVDGGIVYYRIGGEEYTVDDTGEPKPDGTPIDVYLDPDEPSEALLPRPVRWVEGGAILACFVAAGLLPVVAALRRRRRNRLRPTDPRMAAPWR